MLLRIDPCFDPRIEPVTLLFTCTSSQLRHRAQFLQSPFQRISQFPQKLRRMPHNMRRIEEPLYLLQFEHIHAINWSVKYSLFVTYNIQLNTYFNVASVEI